MASCVQCSLARTAAIPAQRSLGSAHPVSHSLSVSQSPQSSSTLLCARHAQVAQVASRKVLVRAEAEVQDGAVASASDVDIQDPSAFISDLSGLVKLVDSRDIVELELKHANYEILIRKKEAVDAHTQSKAQQSQAAAYQTFPGPHVMAHTPFQYPQQMAPYEQAPQQQAPPPPPAPAAPAAPAKALSAGAGLPPMLSPMAGTFYRSPAPSEPSFVQVGDKVVKGQVVCIIEAMKLMNEIEADQSGTVVEIVAADGKPVSIESPLFVIKP